MPPPPKDVHFLIPGTDKYVTLHDKRDFTDAIKLRILKEIILDHAGEASVIKSTLPRGKHGDWNQRPDM